MWIRDSSDMGYETGQISDIGYQISDIGYQISEKVVIIAWLLQI